MHIHRSPDPSTVRRLLEASNLPTEDLEVGHPVDFLGCGDASRPAGAIGLEAHGAHGLLRSLVVSPEVRGAGCGKALVAGIEARAQAQGLADLYLLTETAAPFFASLGYEVVERDAVPAPIRRTTEFSSLCPDTATVMRKDLAD